MPFDEVIQRLRPLSVCYGTEEATDVETGPDGDPHALMTWYRHGPSADEDDWDMIGFLHVDKGRLAADVATRTLADRLVAEIAARLGAAAMLVETRPSTPVRVHDRGYWFPTLQSSLDRPRT